LSLFSGKKVTKKPLSVQLLRMNRLSPARFFCFGIGLHICLYGTNVRRRALVILRLVKPTSVVYQAKGRMQMQNAVETMALPCLG
jgi:hypothetical protein